MKQKKGCGGLTEEDCVSRTHARDVGEGRQRAGNNSGGEKNERAEMLKRC